MKPVILLASLLMAIIHGFSQTAPSMAEMQKLMSMTPAQQEAYKQEMIKKYSTQAKELAAKGNIKLDEMALPDFKVQMPPKDLKRLSLIPKQPPTLIQLGDMLRSTKKQIETAVKPAIVQEVSKITQGQDASALQQSAIGSFYADKPEHALLIGIEAAMKDINDPTGWNNVAAIMNMTGFQHKAIPILMNQLQSDPNNSMMLNNMGQAWLGLGDLGMAEMFLKQCLLQDPLNPEANRSMGMIKFSYDQIEEGMRYFEKELEVAYRRSTMSLMRGNDRSFNLFKLFKKRNIPNRDFLSELSFGNFKIPALPENTNETANAKIIGESFSQSVAEEMMYWHSKAQLSEKEIAQDGQKMPGIYAHYAEALWEDLHKVYTPHDLAFFNEFDLNQIKAMLDEYHSKLMAVKCPTAPAGASHGEYEAYIQKCCDLKKPIMDAFVAEYNAFVTRCGKRAVGIWKQYLNDLINIVSLDPTAGNKISVYKNLAEYCSILSQCWGAGQFLDPPQECSAGLTTAEADSIIASARNLDLNCPEWLNIEVDVIVAKLKGDCSKFGIEAGKLWQASYEHNFRTGTTTLAAGVGVKAKFFANIGGADIKGMVYVSFDNNNQLSDVGVMGKTSVKIGDSPFKIAGGNGSAGGTAGGTEGMVKYGLNSGFSSGVKGTGALAEVVKIDKSL